MTCKAVLKAINIGHSQRLNRKCYQVTFDMVDEFGPSFDRRAIVTPVDEEMSTTAQGPIVVEVPCDKASERDAIVKAREVLHQALTRLAAAANTPSFE